MFPWMAASRTAPTASVTVRAVLGDRWIPAVSRSVAAAWAKESKAPQRLARRHTPGLWLSRPRPSRVSQGVVRAPQAGQW